MSAAEQFLYDAQAFALPGLILLVLAVWCLVKEWAASDRRDAICGTCSYCRAKRESKEEES